MNEKKMANMLDKKSKNLKKLRQEIKYFDIVEKIKSIKMSCSFGEVRKDLKTIIKVIIESSYIVSNDTEINVIKYKMKKKISKMSGIPIEHTSMLDIEDLEILSLNEKESEIIRNAIDVKYLIEDNKHEKTRKKLINISKFLLGAMK